MNPGGGSGWDEPPLDIQVPDDARELDRDVLAYHREQRAQRRRKRLRRLTAPFAGQGTVMPLLASILAVCLVAGAMLSVATFSPATGPANPSHHPPATAASGRGPPRSGPAPSSPSAQRPRAQHPQRPELDHGTSSTGSSTAASPSRSGQPNGPAVGLGELLGPIGPSASPATPRGYPAARKARETPRQRPAA